MAIYFVTNLWESSIMDDYLEIYNVQLYACSVIKRDLSYCPLCSNCKDNNMNYHLQIQKPNLLMAVQLAKFLIYLKVMQAKLLKICLIMATLIFYFPIFIKIRLILLLIL